MTGLAKVLKVLDAVINSVVIGVPVMDVVRLACNPTPLAPAIGPLRDHAPDNGRGLEYLLNTLSRESYLGGDLSIARSVQA